MTNKIFRSTIFVAAVVLLCSLGIILGFLYDHFTGVQEDQLREALNYAVAGTELNGETFLESVEGDDFRLTWISSDGTVLYDSETEAADMENHADREEVKEALRSGKGRSTRYSRTMTEKTIYEAVRLSDGTVLRISVSLASAGALLLGMFHPFVIVAVIAIILSAVLAKRMAKRIVEPLNQLNLEQPLENDAYEELSPLLRRINQQHEQIDAQLRTLKRKTSEFEQITGSMKEGLILLDAQGQVLSLNPAARAIFETGGYCVGKSFLTVDRRYEMSTAVENAMEKGHSTLREQRKGREYQFDISRIQADGATVGAVLLAFDVTEQTNAERNRREFSANVSHELKTPLQSIIGSAELLEKGLVKQEDMPRFVGHIRGEATHLINLVEDIIRLSQLDEGVEIPKEEVDLLALAEEAAASLHGVAMSEQVSVEVTGENRCVTGVRRLLYEIIYNLCDNAVKYNVPGGSVKVSVTAEDGHTVLRVADTGIGIPDEHQDRVFERFYRVDKSHSKQSGGTGLGLSIVKHAAQYHNAQLELQSTPGKGTTVTVTF